MRAARVLSLVLAAGAAFLLLAHGLIHLWFVAPPDPAMARALSAEASWLAEAGVGVALVRGATVVLAVASAALFAASAVGVLGWWMTPAAWRRTTIAACVVSLALLLVHLSWLERVGIAVDLLLLAALLTPLPGRLGIPRARRHPA